MDVRQFQEDKTKLARDVSHTCWTICWKNVNHVTGYFNNDLHVGGLKIRSTYVCTLMYYSVVKFSLKNFYGQ